MRDWSMGVTSELLLNYLEKGIIEKTEPDPDPPSRCSAKEGAKRKSSYDEEHKRNVRNIRWEKML